MLWAACWAEVCLSSTEVFGRAEAYGVTRASGPGTLRTKAAQRAMDETGVVPVTKNYKGWKVWVDAGGQTRPEEIRRTEQLMDQHRRKFRS